LKQAPRAWYAKINNFFLHLGFTCCEFDHSLHVLHTHGNTFIFVVYVDELAINGNNIDLILRLKKQLVDSFDMKDLGILHYFFYLQVLQLSDGLFISQSKNVMDLLTHFKMVDCEPCATPFQYGFKLSKNYQSPKVDATLYRQLLDSLIYLTHSRPDISFVVSLFSWFMQDPMESHWKVVKIIVRYLQGTTHLGIKYYRSSNSLVGFTDSE